MAEKLARVLISAVVGDGGCMQWRMLELGSVEIAVEVMLEVRGKMPEVMESRCG